MSEPRYAELQVTSHISFLRGASSCEELFAQAAFAGIEALAVVDRNSLAGIVRAHEAAKTTGVRLIVGCRLDLADGMSVLVYPTDRLPIPVSAAYCRSASGAAERQGACSNGRISSLTAKDLSPSSCRISRMTNAAFVCADCAMRSAIGRIWL